MRAGGHGRFPCLGTFCCCRAAPLADTLHGMLDNKVIAAIVSALQSAEVDILERVREGTIREEEDLTSRLLENIGLRVTLGAGMEKVTIKLTTTTSRGAASQEPILGADMLVVVSVDVGGAVISKGFLAQAKLAGQNIRYLPGTPRGTDSSHVFARRDVTVAPSGTVSIGTPSKKLAEQCDKMLARSPASFVIVYSDEQVSVVSASAIIAQRRAADSGRRPDRLVLGTKRLADLFINVVDCFIGDTQLAAANADELARLARELQVPNSLLLEVTDQQ